MHVTPREWAGFARRYHEVCSENERGVSRNHLADVGAWRGFVSRCREGYGENFAEYRSDIWIRRYLQAALDDELLRSIHGFAEFSSMVNRIDGKFREVATVAVAFPGRIDVEWWNLIVPRYGSEELHDDIERIFGVEIEVID